MDVTGFVQTAWSRTSPHERVGVSAVLLFVAAVVPSPLRRYRAFRVAGPDKLLHLLGYGGFALLLADALTADRRDDRAAAFAAVLISSGYGFLIGTLQNWVPGREHERADDVAGLVGSVLAVVAWRLVNG